MKLITIMDQISVFLANSSISQLIIFMMILLSASSANAEVVEVFVKDSSGHPVDDVIVFLQAEELTRRLKEEQDSPTVMSQYQLQFDPHILVVSTGTSVIFPNNDDVAHHVYSFSKPNNFILDLYKSGDTPAPVKFDHPGVVTMGCNIHDSMLGYILVIDSKEHGKTNSQGVVHLDYDQSWTKPTVSIWSPRIQDRSDKLTVPLDKSGSVVFKLSKKLLPKRTESNDKSKQWQDYQ